jgi:hypothetical protein
VKLGDKLDDVTELMLRQVHPAFLRDGRPSSQTFRPTPKDKGMLSVNRASMTTPIDAYARFSERPDCRSCGVLAVSVAECAAEQLAAFEAPLVQADDGTDDKSHAIIDFRNLTRNAVEKKSGRLVRVALARGFLHGPIEDITSPVPHPSQHGAKTASPLSTAAVVDSTEN